MEEGEEEEEEESAAPAAAVLESGYIYREGEQIKDAETITRTCGLLCSRGGAGQVVMTPLTLEAAQRAGADKGRRDQRRRAAAAALWMDVKLDPMKMVV
ncbi:hypothetical protein EYF80_060482 [Liparis tanakae]|uniref:Uncharacterized protein n=1 Tax=Liparis tanakae TaxID=230148 RepID=A0A4Z2ELD4_9TELE|nr:hypothetical protein EYF80_060482 [Liparis tanakae]